MTEYGIKFFRIEDGEETEVEMDDLPDNYIFGLFEMIRQDVASRERINRVYKRIAEGILSKKRDNIGNYQP